MRDAVNGRAAAGARPRARPRQGPLLAVWPRLCHDLRTPLNAIVANAELLLDGSAGPLSREARACVDDIQNAGLRMTRQVPLLLELCRARSRPAQLEAEAEVDFVALLAAAARQAGSSAPPRVAPDGARLVLRGVPVWLRLLAGALAELYADSATPAPFQIEVEPAARGRRRQLHVWWASFDPDRLEALPLALTDAILDLHNAEVSLSPSGMRLSWPACRAVLVGPQAGLPAEDRKSG